MVDPRRGGQHAERPPAGVDPVRTRSGVPPRTTSTAALRESEIRWRWS
jgi:hypothetical protein